MEVQLRGARSYVGAWSGNFSTATDRDLANAVSIPYFPGRDQLWNGDGMVTDFVGQQEAARDSVNERALVHPLAAGAEAHYRYAIGDSMRLTLPGGRGLLLRELRITAVAPRWNLIVGSFWFDDSTANLVRASYRLSEPTDIIAVTRDQPRGRAMPRWLGALVSPLEYEIAAIVVESELVDERFWLPRIQYLDGTARAGGVRASMRIEQRFSYEDVDGTARPAEPEPRADEVRTVMSRRYGRSVEVNTTVPRDRAALARSPELPASIFDDADRVFDERSRNELLRALAMDLQPEWAPRALQWRYGLPLTRYNRVEGFSTGIAAARPLGRGYTADAMVRGSVADGEVGASLGLRRSNGRTTRRVAAFRQLAASNDWGAPLSAAASAGAFLVGRDDGAYYRTTGLEYAVDRQRARLAQWRLFVEHQSRADVETQWSLLGARSRVLPNPVADDLRLVGASTALRFEHTGPPDAWQFRAAWNLEAATGDADYARSLLDATVSHGIGGPVVAALTTSLGVSAGRLPTQRQFFLGGPQSVRGHRALTAAGDAAWLARAEVALDTRVVRPSVFADVGWAGDRRMWREPGRPMAGAGVGASFFDGLVRVDVARGVQPWRAVRVDLTLDARF